MKYVVTLLNLMLAIAFALFIIDSFSPIEIKSQFLKSYAYLGLIILAPTNFFVNLLYKKSKYLSLFFPALILIAILIIGPTNIIFSSSAWATQEIILENNHLSFKKVEFQMLDQGAMGYKKRTTEVLYLSKYFMITNSANEDLYNSPEWKKVDIEVNELKLKYP